MRIGLVGTGPWARAVHGPGLLRAPGVDLVGVWGRDRDKAAALASRLSVRAWTDYASMLGEVDAVAFAVPPDVQAAMGTTAAKAGKHLLLDKPVALDPGAARELAAAVRSSGVASVVFFTDRFAPDTATWMAQVGRVGGWRGGSVRWLTALGEPGNPFADSAWRWQRGALWDVGPHALSTLATTLGPITEIRGVAGEVDLVHLVITHESGATSTVTLSMQVPASAAHQETLLWGERGVSRMPDRTDATGPDGFAAAVAQLLAAASGADNPVDVHFGVGITELLNRAETQLHESTAAP